MVRLNFIHSIRAADINKDSQNVMHVTHGVEAAYLDFIIVHSYNLLFQKGY